MSSMPAERKVVGNRWVLTDKDDGTLRSRTVAQVFSQVPGKDFTDSHALVMTDLALRLALIVRVLLKLRTRHFPIESAFLYSDLDEEIYMRITEGYVRCMLEVHNVLKEIYGLVQAATQCWKTFKEAMAGCNYFLSKADPCLFIKKANGVKPLTFVIIYVYVGGIIGTPEAIKEVIEALSKSFKVKTMGEMIKFVGCHIIDTADKEGV
jgi:Reverse transcriptase (RNA-dependent DNA polymerase)